MMSTRFKGRDFLELRREMIAFLKERLGDSWTDQGEADDLMTMVELLAYLADNLHYYIDAQKRESDIVTAVLEKNIVEKATRDGYKPHLSIAPSGHVVLLFEEPIESPIHIPRGTVVQTEDSDDPEDNMYAVVLEDQIVPEGTIQFDLVVFGGRLRTETKSRGDITQTGYIRLDTHKAAEDSMRLIYDGDVWDEVDDVYTDFRIGRLCSLHIRFFREAAANIVQLPYNWPMYISDDSSITIEYLETEGVYSNIGPGRISRINMKLEDEDGNDWTDRVTVNNPQPITGGMSRESIDSIKTNFKSSIRNLETLVTTEDYADFASLWTGKECLAIDWRTAPDIITEPHTVRILVDLNEQQREELREELKRRQGRGDIIEVGQIAVREYDIEMVCYLGSFGDSEEKIREKILKGLAHEYEETSQKGKGHYRSRMVQIALNSSDRIKNVEVIYPEEDIIPEEFEIAKYRNVEIRFEVI